MLRHAAVINVFMTALLFAAMTTTTSAQAPPSAVSRETIFLHSFDGRFAGTGRLERADGSGHALTCKFKGTSEARHVVLEWALLDSDYICHINADRYPIRYGDRALFGLVSREHGHHCRPCRLSPGGLAIARIYRDAREYSSQPARAAGNHAKG
jgi:hypothetical protein